MFSCAVTALWSKERPCATTGPIMQELGAIVALARGLSVHVTGSGLSELAAFDTRAAGPNHEACVATLHLERSTVAIDSLHGGVSYRADLQWSGPQAARFFVPGGRGELAIAQDGPMRVAVTLCFDPQALQIAAETTFRLLLSLLLPSVGGLLVHASAVVHEGRASVFLGHSGAGKTTTARRLGREGAEVVAEDLLILRGADGELAVVEACRFDVAHRHALPAHVDSHWPIEGAYVVRKGAAVSGRLGRAAFPLRTWSEAIFSPRMVGRSSSALIEALAFAASRVPLYDFAAAPTGALRPALSGDEGRER